MFLYKNFNILNLIQFYLDAGSGRELGQLQLPESVSQESKQDMNNAMTRFYVPNDEEEKDTMVKSASLKALDCKKSRPQFY